METRITLKPVYQSLKLQVNEGDLLPEIIQIDRTSVKILNVTQKGDNGVGVPTGGTTGQVLAKNSNDDYDTEWTDPTSGGTVDSVNGQTGVVVLDTDDVAEGSTNLYFTNSRADARITAQKGAANGLATLDGASKIPSSQLPALAITDTFVVSSLINMLLLTAQVGDVAIRTDENKSYILQTEPATVQANWKELLTPTDAVLSVNGQTGAVTVLNSIVQGENIFLDFSDPLNPVIYSSGQSDPDGTIIGTGVSDDEFKYNEVVVEVGSSTVVLRDSDIYKTFTTDGSTDFDFDYTGITIDDFTFKVFVNQRAPAQITITTNGTSIWLGNYEYLANIKTAQRGASATVRLKRNRINITNLCGNWEGN